MRSFLVVLFATAVAFAAGQTPTLPDGPGKTILNSACLGCHGLDLVTGKQASKKDWADTVDRMKSYGVSINAADSTTLVDYLAASFGPKTAPAAAPAGTPGSEAADTEGKALVSGLCSSCHGDDLVTSKRASRTEWQAVIDRMKAYGAVISEKQNTTLLDYLTKQYGPKDAPPATTAPTPTAAAVAADPGKKILEDYCGSCHDVDLVDARRSNQSEWQDVVDRMNSRGAGVPDKDVLPLVQYLAKTYGPTTK